MSQSNYIGYDNCEFGLTHEILACGIGFGIVMGGYFCISRFCLNRGLGLEN